MQAVKEYEQQTDWKVKMKRPGSLRITSAIRYYEQMGLLESADRAGGQRRYDSSVFYRLSIVRRAQQVGFTLDETHELLTGFVPGTPASERWKRLSIRKLEELAAKLSEIQLCKVYRKT